MFELIGETLRRLRKERGLTLDQLGKQAGLGRGQLSRIENMKQEATLSTVAKILQCQGVSRREFFRRYDLVESEARALEREAGGDAKPPSAEAGWPQTLQEAASRLEGFIQSALRDSEPVSQGAVQFGDLLFLFRAVRAETATGPAPPAGPGGEVPAASERPGPRGRKRKR